MFIGKWWYDFLCFLSVNWREMRCEPTWQRALTILPRSLTWNLKISPWKRRFLLEIIIFRFHVKFPGCNILELPPTQDASQQQDYFYFLGRNPNISPSFVTGILETERISIVGTWNVSKLTEIDGTKCMMPVFWVFESPWFMHSVR